MLLARNSYSPLADRSKRAVKARVAFGLRPVGRLGGLHVEGRSLLARPEPREGFERSNWPSGGVGCGTSSTAGLRPEAA